MDITNTKEVLVQLGIAKVDYKDNEELVKLLSKAANSISLLLSMFPRRLTEGQTRPELNSGNIVMSAEAYGILRQFLYLPEHAQRCELVLEHQSPVKYTVAGYVATETGITFDSEQGWVRKK